MYALEPTETMGTFTSAAPTPIELRRILGNDDNQQSDYLNTTEPSENEKELETIADVDKDNYNNQEGEEFVNEEAFPHEEDVPDVERGVSGVSSRNEYDRLSEGDGNVGAEPDDEERGVSEEEEREHLNDTENDGGEEGGEGRGGGRGERNSPNDDVDNGHSKQTKTVVFSERTS